MTKRSQPFIIRVSGSFWPGTITITTAHISNVTHNQTTILRPERNRAFSPSHISAHEHSVPAAKSRKNNDKAYHTRYPVIFIFWKLGTLCASTIKRLRPMTSKKILNLFFIPFQVPNFLFCSRSYFDWCFFSYLFLAAQTLCMLSFETSLKVLWRFRFVANTLDTFFPLYYIGSFVTKKTRQFKNSQYFVKIFIKITTTN